MKLKNIPTHMAFQIIARFLSVCSYTCQFIIK
jgi:hypothetical protein